MQALPSIDDRGARKCVCESRCVHSSRNLWFRQIKAVGGAFQGLAHSQRIEHTHMQWCVQGVTVVCSLSLHPAGEARLTKPDWHCQELGEQSEWIRWAALWALFVGKSLLSSVLGQRSKQQSSNSEAGGASGAASSTIQTHGDQSWWSVQEFLVNSLSLFKMLSNRRQSVNTRDNLCQASYCVSFWYFSWPHMMDQHKAP